MDPKLDAQIYRVTYFVAHFNSTVIKGRGTAISSF